MEKVELSFKELEKREQSCDVKISDYIRKHYKEKVLFYGRNHPINEVMFEVTKRILKCLNIRETRKYNEVENDFTLQSQDVPVYPAVKAVLGIPEGDALYYANKNLWPFKADIKNFLIMYANMCLLGKETG